MNNVLLVEDNALNRMVIEDLFEYGDIPAMLFSVENGEEAIEVARQRKPAMVLMDLELPGMSGLETMRHLREDPKTRDIPVWAISAHAMKGDAAQALAAGFNAYVTKPIDTRQLTEQIRQFLSGVPIEETAPCSPH